VLSRERLFTLRRLSEIWFGDNWKRFYCTVRRWFLDEPGVIIAGTGKKNRLRLIPESVAERVYQRRMNGGRP